MTISAHRPAAPSIVTEPTFSSRIWNFSAGPAAMPLAVLEALREDLLNVAGSGVGIMEQSHRGPVYERIHHDAIDAFRRVAGVGDAHEILFLAGGATLQFAMIPMSFLPHDGVADYLDTGVWAAKAIDEAEAVGRVHIAFSGQSTDPTRHYTHLPKTDELDRSPDAAYLHYCANNTVFATQFPDLVSTPPVAADDATPLICDLSSEILSRPVDWERHALAYACCQKNLGPAGVTIVVIRRDFMERARTGLPSMLDYRAHAHAGSRLNTPPTFGVAAVGHMVRWLESEGGVAEMERRSIRKAETVYAAIDRSNGFYRGLAETTCRSRMNASFRLPTPELEDRFVDEAEAAGLSGLRGHRTAGGIRVSMYNAIPQTACDAVAVFMDDFARRNG